MQSRGFPYGRSCSSDPGSYRAAAAHATIARVNSKPAIIVRARIDPNVMERFLRWHAETHMPHVLAIPGIAKARRVRHSRELPGQHQMEFELEDEQSIQKVMGSPEAQLAQQDWADWASSVHELSVEIYAPLGPLPQYHSTN